MWLCSSQTFMKIKKSLLLYFFLYIYNDGYLQLRIFLMTKLNKFSAIALEFFFEFESNGGSFMRKGELNNRPSLLSLYVYKIMISLPNLISISYTQDGSRTEIHQDIYNNVLAIFLGLCKGRIERQGIKVNQTSILLVTPQYLFSIIIIMISHHYYTYIC